MSFFWKINCTCLLHLHEFNHAHSMVFDEASSQTHSANQLCLDAIKTLQQGPLNSQLLAETLARCNDFSLDEEWLDYINEMLTDLDRLGLIEPVVP